MANHILDPEYFKRLADLIRRWCRDEPLPFGDEKWMTDQMIAWLWKDATCARRLGAAGFSQGIESRACIASDYLGEVLARNPNALRQLLSDMLGTGDAALASMCRRRVIMRVQNLLYHRWKESDEIGASIDKGLSLELRNHPELYILLPDSSPSPRFVTNVRNGQLRTDRPIITLEEMLRLIAEVWKGSRQIPGCVRSLMTLIRDDHQWCALVPIYDVLFKSLCESASQGIMRAEELKFTPSEMSPDVARVLKASLVPTMEVVRQALQTYVDDRKLTPVVADGLYAAVEHIYEDFGLSGDRNLSHAEYVVKFCPGISKEESNRTIRSRFQYVMRQANETLDREFKSRWGDDSANPENHD